HRRWHRRRARRVPRCRQRGRRRHDVSLHVTGDRMRLKTAVSTAVAVPAVGLIYAAIARAVISIDIAGMAATLIWTPIGLGLGVVIVYGPVFALSIVLGTYIAVTSVGGDPLVAIAIGITNALEALVALHAMRHFG